MHDILIAAGLLAIVGAGVAYTVKAPPGGLIRLLGGEHPGHHVRPAGTPRAAHAAPLVHHAAPRALPAAPAALTTTPDARPFTARTAS